MPHSRPVSQDSQQQLPRPQGVTLIPTSYGRYNITTWLNVLGAHVSWGHGETTPKISFLNSNSPLVGVVREGDFLESINGCSLRVPPHVANEPTSKHLEGSLKRLKAALCDDSEVSLGLVAADKWELDNGIWNETVVHKAASRPSKIARLTGAGAGDKKQQQQQQQTDKKPFV